MGRRANFKVDIGFSIGTTFLLETSIYHVLDTIYIYHIPHIIY